MQIQIGRFMAKPHDSMCWELFEWKLPKQNQHSKDEPTEEKWCALGRCPSTFAQALEDLCELAVKDEPGIYDVKDAVAAAKRIERSIERAAKDALAKEER